MVDELQEIKSNWRIMGNPSWPGPPRIIVNTTLPIPLTKEAYDYVTYIPVILAPISRSSTLVLSASNNNEKLGLSIHDLRLVDDQIVSSINFTLRGNQFQLDKFKNEMNRVADADRCVGVSYFLRKLFYNNFRTIYADKILHPKVDSSLRRAINVVTVSVNNQISVDQKEKE